MILKRWISKVRLWAREARRNHSVLRSSTFQKNRIEAEIIRNVHSIEKGLSLEKPRLGFGAAKIKELFSLLEIYRSLQPADAECLFFARDALQAYLDFHASKGYDDNNIAWIRTATEKFREGLPKNCECFGGVEILTNAEMNFDVEQIERLFNTRHSIREFSGENVSDEALEKAIRLAQRAPSACNRQAVRVYSINGATFVADMGKALEGIGGFADDVDKFLLITGKKSAYRDSEKNQFAVSASIFAAYLSLTLHTYKIANCIIQRPLTPTKGWDKICDKYNIPRDEQLVVLIGIGGYKEKSAVPTSKRYGLKEVYRRLD